MKQICNILKDRECRKGNLNHGSAIVELCMICIGNEPSEIRDCPCEDCPLHSLRSGDGKQTAKEMAHAIRSFCLLCKGNVLSEIPLCVLTTCPLYSFRLCQKQKASSAISCHSQKEAA